MSQWICCNSCFKYPGPDVQLALTSCGHVFCNRCFQKGKEGECVICKAKCQLYVLSDKSSSTVRALFSDISITAVKYFSDISKVLQFQARQQKWLLGYYQQKTEKMKEASIKMQQEMKQMSKKIIEQKAYISKLEVALQQQSSGVRLQSNKDLHASSCFNPGYSMSPTLSVSSLAKIPYFSSACPSPQPSCTSLNKNMDVDCRDFASKPSMSGSLSRLCLISPPQDGRIGTIPHRTSSQSTLVGHSIQSANVSRVLSSSLQEPMMASSSDMAYCREMLWETPVFKMPQTYKYPSMSSLGPPP